MNSIWNCIVELQKDNPKIGSKVKVLTGKIECLVILDENKNYVGIKTNESVVGRYIKSAYGKTFSIDNIYMVRPLTNHGVSLAKI